jgi:orotidine-5'-phosphate decarboxylase
MPLASNEEETRSRLIVAMDVSDEDGLAPFLQIFHAFPGVVAKAGLELILALGVPRIMQVLSDAGARVMVDFKGHDIPETISRASRVAAREGAYLITVHTGGGGKMLKAAVQGAAEGSDFRSERVRKNKLTNLPTQVLGVTVLTSMDRKGLASTGHHVVDDESAIRSLVVLRARLTAECGGHGVVASPREAAAVHEACPSLILVTPSVTLSDGSTRAGSDQARIGTVYESVRAGGRVVVGRAIREALDPLEAVRAHLLEIERGLQARQTA